MFNFHINSASKPTNIIIFALFKQIKNTIAYAKLSW